MYDLKWRFQRLFKRSKENGMEFFEDFGHDIWEVIKIPYDLIKEIFRFVKRVIKYTPILWNDCDFDFHSTLVILKFKIQNLADHIEEHQLHTTYKKDVKNMRIVCDLIQKSLDDNYHDEVQVKMQEKWGRYIWYREDDLFTSIKSPNSISTTSRYDKENNSNSEQIRKEYLKLTNQCTKIREKDWNKLWNIINKECRNWWD